jgi:hypothetical protein
LTIQTVPAPQSKFGQYLPRPIPEAHLILLPLQQLERIVEYLSINQLDRDTG